MRHYWVQSLDEDFDFKSEYFQVLDTIDLTIEEVRLKDYMHCFSSKFINAFYTKTHITKEYEQNGYSPELLVKALPILGFEDGVRFNFPIKDGQVYYDGWDLVINFKDNQSRLKVVSSCQSNGFLVIDDVIEDFLTVRHFYCCLYIRKITKSGTYLFIEFGIVNEEVTITFSLNYHNGRMNYKVRYKTSPEMGTMTIDERLESVAVSVDNLIEQGAYILGADEPQVNYGLIHYAYELGDSMRESISTVVNSYLRAYMKQLLIENTETKAIFKEYMSRIGFSPEQNIMYSKALFMREK